MKWPLAPTLFASITVLTVIGALFRVPALSTFAATLLAAFVVSEFRRVPRPQQVASAILLILTLGIAIPNGLLWEAVANGLLRTLPFALIFASVVWLQSAARESPSVQNLREQLAAFGPGHRFAALSGAAHVLGSGFNLAAVALLAPMFEREPAQERTGMRMRSAVLWGFGSATCWSPLYVGTAAILSSVPAVSWFQILPYGVVLGLYFLVAGFAFDRLVLRRSSTDRNSTPQKNTNLARPALRLSLALIILFALVMGLVEHIGLALTVAIALVAPAYSLIWLSLVHRQGNPARIGAIVGEVFHGLPRMRSETTLFACANIFGYVLADLAASGASFVPALPGPETAMVFRVLIVLLIYLGASAVGIHPIVSLVVFTAIADPAAIGLPLPLLVATMMALWGVGTSVSPFSGTTLFMSQLSGISSFRIAWIWDGPFYLLATVGLAVVVSILA